LSEAPGGLFAGSERIEESAMTVADVDIMQRSLSRSNWVRGGVRKWSRQQAKWSEQASVKGRKRRKATVEGLIVG
jgi:hypothetical protein